MIEALTALYAVGQAWPSLLPQCCAGVALAWAGCSLGILWGWWRHERSRRR